MRGTIALPGSKSISNRTLLLAALAEGRTVLDGLLVADDTARMREALVKLGVALRDEGTRCVVEGCAGRFPTSKAELFLGNAGTAVRPITAAL
ncbi:MAG TPA: 3-phosphoshikimate 1-carboxyvinyltransferase, partial [Casimicrobiaceae bacterium]|nr:3-phosphoshikimate 1-carboxyvinyltransferase [Casimicrobiaceae bacterium]